MNAKTLITNAARFIEERGHCKNQLEDGQGRVCMYGALFLATTYGKSAQGIFLHLELEYPVYLEATKLLTVKASEDFGRDFVDWNNRKKRTQKEVTDFMHEVAGTKRSENDDKARTKNHLAT